MSLPKLRQIVQRVGPLDYKRAARYVEEVARQLADLHHRGRLHPDIRPEMIFLDDAETVRLEPVVSDSKGEDYDVMELDDEYIMEIADCLAPERALGAMTVDGRADIYSLGCVLYFLLVGRAPFSTSSIAERLLMHQTDTPDAICHVWPDVPQRQAQICEKTMATKPSDRYQSATERLDALASWHSSTG